MNMARSGKQTLLPLVHISMPTLLSGLICCNQTKGSQTNVDLTSEAQESENWQNRILPCVSVSAQKGVAFSRQTADVLVCRTKTFSHVQIFVLDQNKRKATIPLCTMEVRDCGTPQHLKCKSNLIVQNKADILWIVSRATRVLATGWHGEISKCWGVLPRIGQVTGLLPFVCSSVQMDAQIHSMSQVETKSLHGN